MASTNTRSASLLAISTALLLSAGAYGDTPSPPNTIVPVPDASGTTTPDRAQVPEAASPSALPNFQLVRFLPRLKFKVGEVRVYRITLKQSWQETLTGYQAQGMDVSEAATATETVKSYNPKDGTGTLLIRFSSVSLTANGQTCAINSIVKPFRDETVVVTLRSDGYIISVQNRGPDAEPYFKLLHYYNQDLLSSSADFPGHPVDIGATWTHKFKARKSQVQTAETVTLLDIKNLDGKNVGYFHSTFTTYTTGRVSDRGLVNAAFGGNIDGYADKSFDLNGGYLRSSSGMVHQYGAYNLGLTQRAYDSGYTLRSGSAATDCTSYYTVDLVKVIR